jgi:hypothetical protein
VARLRTAASAVLVWCALVVPDRLGLLTPGAFVRIPLEGPLALAVLLLLPRRTRAVAAVVAGLLAGLLVLVEVLDIGFAEALGRPFDPLTDWSYGGPAVGLLTDSVGHTGAVLVLAGAGVLAVAVLLLLPLSVLRLATSAARHRAAAMSTIVVLGTAWLLCAVLGVQIVPDTPVASTSAARLAYGHLHQLRVDVRDDRSFAHAVADDRFRDTPADRLLRGLRGHDVVIAFVESYGRVALDGAGISSPVDAALDTGTARLRDAGISARSAFLDSPTFGGLSWLAHSTLQTGLWVDDQQRYDHVVAGDRLTLSDAFRRAGWRTVGDVPSNGSSWPAGRSFYHYDKLYNAWNVGYAGPSYSYATMPDQYTLAAFERSELARHRRRPVMAEIDLVSSHTPWTPLPRPVPWNEVGDGSVYSGLPPRGPAPDVLWRDPERVRRAYARSITYSLDTVVSFLRTYQRRDRSLVVVLLGDHQPATVVSGQGASHEVPVTVIARDPAVLSRISGWGWQDGLRPGRDAPVWPMDAFRDRFLAAYAR